MNSLLIHRDNLFRIDQLAFQADISGALHIPSHKTLIVADLHFEKAATLNQKRGASFPPFDSRETLMRLRDVIIRLDPKRIIFLGDTWHDSYGPFRMRAEDHAFFRDLIFNRQAEFVAGNHDENISEIEGLTICKEIKIGEVIFRHEPIDDKNLFQISGHLHPVAKVKQKGRVIRRRCFYLSDRQCVLPAMGVLTGGLNCLDPVYERFMSIENRRVVVLGRDRLYHLGMNKLIVD